MLKKIFTAEQLSLFLQIAILTNIISLFCDLIVYHYFPHHITLNLFITNVDNATTFATYLILISQALLIFFHRNQYFIKKYQLLGITFALCIAVFFFWIITIESEILSKTIIFSSSLSNYDHSYKLILILIAIFTFLAFDFYKTLTNPEHINNKSVAKMLRSSFLIVLRRHLLILIFFLGIVRLKALHKFSQLLLSHSQTSLFFDLNFLEYIIAIIWIVGIGYYLYQHYHHENKDR